MILNQHEILPQNHQQKRGEYESALAPNELWSVNRIWQDNYNYNLDDYNFNNHAENEAGRLVPDLFLLFKKALKLKNKYKLYEVKVSGLQLSFNIFR